jgi:hypothetical protein
MQRMMLKVAALSLLATTFAPGVADGSPSALNWATRGATIACRIAEGIPGTAFDPGTQAQLDGRWPGLVCAAGGSLRLYRGTNEPLVGKFNVQLGEGRTGRARPIHYGESSQPYAFASSQRFFTVSPGMKWVRDGITCSVKAQSIRCVNAAGHGFTMTPTHLGTF